MDESVVLIVEDNERNRKLARDVLSFHGFKTLEAATAGEGIERASTAAPDAILMDIELPDLDGLSTLEQLRDDERTRDIPVIALTASAMQGDRERFLDAGFAEYISKPIEVTAFADQVKRVIERAADRRS